MEKKDITDKEFELIKMIRITGGLAIRLERVHDQALYFGNNEIDEDLIEHLYFTKRIFSLIEEIEKDGGAA